MVEKQGNGNFFLVDRRTWIRTCGIGINEAVALLVLARGSGPDNVTTCWSADAIERYTGIARRRCKEAISRLCEAKIISVERSGTRPRYRINDIVDAPRPARKSRNTTAENDGAQNENWLWLPNAIVTGAAQETPPVELLRQTQDVMLLRLFVELYGEQDLVADGGIPRNLMWRKFDRLHAGQQGEFIIWAFAQRGQWVSEMAVSKPHYDPQKKPGEEGRAENWFSRIAKLGDLGLIEWVHYLAEGEENSAELIHPCWSNEENSVEAQIGATADQAGRRMLTEAQIERAEAQLNSPPFFVPVRRHLDNVQMTSIARLRYRPLTSRTTAWWAKMQNDAPKWVEKYRALATSRSPASLTLQNAS